MKLTTVSAAVAVAICSASALHAANIPQPNEHTPQAVNINQEQAKQVADKFHQVYSSSMLQNDGLNVQLN